MNQNTINSPQPVPRRSFSSRLKTPLLVSALMGSVGAAVSGASKICEYTDERATVDGTADLIKNLQNDPDRHIFGPLQAFGKSIDFEIDRFSNGSSNAKIDTLKFRLLDKPGSLEGVYHGFRGHLNELVISPPVTVDSSVESGTDIVLDKYEDQVLGSGMYALNDNTWIYEPTSPFYGPLQISCQKKRDIDKDKKTRCHQDQLMIEFQQGANGATHIKDISILIRIDEGLYFSTPVAARKYSIKDKIKFDEQKLGLEIAVARAKMLTYRSDVEKAENTFKLTNALEDFITGLRKEVDQPVKPNFVPNIRSYKFRLLRKIGKPEDASSVPSIPLNAQAEEEVEVVFDRLDLKSGGFIGVRNNTLLVQKNSTSDTMIIEFEELPGGKDKSIKSIHRLVFINNNAQPVYPNSKTSGFRARRFIMKEQLEYDVKTVSEAFVRAKSKLTDYKDFLRKLEGLRAEEAAHKANPDHHKDLGFGLKLEHGMLKIETTTAAWNGSRSWCSGWIAGANVIGTARHCVTDNGRERLLTGVSRIVANGGQRAETVPYYAPKTSRDYSIAYFPKEDNTDLAVIVLNNQTLPANNILKVRSGLIVPGNYYTAHFAGYDSPQIWKIDKGQVRQGVWTSLNFDFSNQGGNSGGPIVDYNGDVVSLHALSTSTDSRSNSEGPLITQKLMDELIKQAKGRIAKIKN